MTATLSGGDLLISSTAAGDVLAEISSDGMDYTVSGTGLAATQFAIASVTGRISVGDPVGVDGQTFRVRAGVPLANPLQVTASIETTELRAGISATVAGPVSILSASVVIGSLSPVSVSTSGTHADVTMSGAVTLANDATFTSGSGTIRLGSVAGPSAQALFLGDENQSGAVEISGNVSLPQGFLITDAAAFDVSLDGSANAVSLTQFANTGFVRIGQAGGTSTFRDGLSVTSANIVVLSGVVETVNAPLTLGSVYLLADTTLRSGSGAITTGAVTDGVSSRTLTLGSLTQTGDVTLGGSTTVDGLATAAGDFAVSLLGSANEIGKQVTFTNTKHVVFGDGPDDVSRFAAGVTATSQATSNVLSGTVRTAGGSIDIGGLYLSGATTLDTSDAGAVAGGAPITLRSGAGLEGHVLTTIGGVGGTAQGTYLLGTGDFGSGPTGSGSLVVQAGSLFIGDGATSTAALTVANDTTIRVAAGGLTVGADSTIDARGAALTLLADDVTIASAPGSIAAERIALTPVTAGRDVFLAATGTGLVLDAAELQAVDADTVLIGETGYGGRVTLGTLTLTDTALAIVADGEGGGVTLDGPFTATGSLPGGMGLEITGSGAGTVLNADITSTGNVFIHDAVEIAAGSVTIDTSAGGGDVSITGGATGIWSSKGESNDLVVKAGAGSAILATFAGLNDNGGQADFVRNVTLAGGSILLRGGNVISGGLSLGAPQITLSAVVRAAGPIGIDDGAGGDAAVVILSNTILDTTQEGRVPAGHPVTIRGTVTALEANNYFFNLKGGTDGDVLVTGRIGVVGNGAALGTVNITGNDLTVAAIDGLSQGLFLEAVDAVGGVDPGSVTLTGTTYTSASALAIMVGARSATNELGDAENRITLAGGTAGATTSFVTSGFDVEFSGNVNLAGRNLSIDTTNGGTAARDGFILINDAIDGAGTLRLDAGSAGTIAVNHLSGATGGATPLLGVTVSNAGEVGFSGDLHVGTVRIVDATSTVTFSGVLDITGGLITEAQPYAVRLFGGNGGSSRIAGVTTFENTGRVTFGDQGAPDVITFVGGLVATAPSEVRLVGSVLADSGSIVLGDADTDVIVRSGVVGGAVTSITLADVILDENGWLTLGTGLANTVQVGSVAGTVTGFADAFSINTTGTVTITGSVGSGLDRLTVTKSGGTTFAAAVAAGTVTLTDTTGTITFQGDLTATTLTTAANGYTVGFQGAATTVADTTTFLNTGWVWFGNGAGDVATFTGGLSTSGGPINTVLAGTLASSGSVSLGVATLVTNMNFRGPLITFGGTLHGGSFGLTTSDPFSPEGGDAEFGGAVTAGFLSIFGTTTIAGPSVTTSGDQNYINEVTITAPSVVLRGAGGTSSRIATVAGSNLELDFDDGFTLHQTTPPFSLITGTLRVSDGILVGSAIVGSLALTPAATFQVTLPLGPYGSGQIQVAFSSSATIALGSAALSLTGSAPLPLGTNLRIIDNGSMAPVTGTFAGLPEGALIDTPVGVCRISYTGGDGNDVTLEVVTRDNVVTLESDRLFLRLAGTGTTVRNLSTQYLPATRRLVVTVAADRPLTGGGQGLTINQRAGTVTVNLVEVPAFGGITVVGTGATDRITLGPKGVNLAALTRGSANQVLEIGTGGGVDVVTVRSPVRTKGPDGGVFIGSAVINVGTAVSTQLGRQLYVGHVRLVGNTSVVGHRIGFNGAVDGGHKLTINATQEVDFYDAVGGSTPLKGITVQRATSFTSPKGLRLDGRGLAPTANGLVIGRGVGNVAIYSDDPAARPVTINNFGGSGILFQGGSTSFIGLASLAGNGQGITFLPGDYAGTTVVANEILRSKRAGIVLDNARNVWIGDDVTGSENLIQGGAVPRLSGKGIVAKGLLTGSRVVGNTIERNNGGIVMQDARGLTVGGAPLLGGAPRANTIIGNVAWGLVATGNCTGSVLDVNTFSGNAPGNVNVARARGLVVVPSG